MKVKRIVSILAVCSILFSQGLGFAQIKADLSDYYLTYDGKTPEENLEENVSPLLGLFGHYTGSNLFNTGKTHGMLGFDIGVKAMILFVGDNVKTSWPAGQGGVQGGPLGENTTIALPMLHAGIGLFPNLEVIGRVFSYNMAETAIGDGGNITLLGAGVKYGIMQTLLLPKVSIIAAYHKLVVPEDFDFRDVQTISLDLVISKGIPMLATFYGGVGLDRSSISVDVQQISSSFDFTESMFRGVVGVKVDFIPLVYLSADYNFGAHQGVNLGLGLSLR